MSEEKRDDFLNDLLAQCGKTPEPEGGDFLAQSIKKRGDHVAALALAEKFRAAASAAEGLNGVVQKAVALSYKGRFSEKPVLGGGFLTGYFGGLAGGAAALISFGIGAGLLVPLVLFPTTVMGAVTGYKLRDKEPVRQFSGKGSPYEAFWFFAKDLPDCPEKKLLQDFADAAKANYLLGYAATLRKQFLYGEFTVRRVEKMKKQGQALIDEAAKIIKWDEASTQCLKTEFSQGRGDFPTAQDFAAKLDTQYRAAMAAVDTKIHFLRYGA